SFIGERFYEMRAKGQLRSDGAGGRHLDRDREGEARPLAERRGDLDLAAVELDEALDDREAEPGALLALGRLAAALLVAAEELREVLGRDPLAGVLDGDLDLRAEAADLDRDHVALARELDRVRDEVVEHLRDPLGIEAHRLEVARHVELELDLLRPR